MSNKIKSILKLNNKLILVIFFINWLEHLYGNGSGTWFRNYAGLVSNTLPWTMRSSYSTDENYSGIFGFGRANGSVQDNKSLRVVLTAEDN